MPDWSIAVPAFLTAAVEWVEAFTIVLAVSLTLGWRSAGAAAAAALLVLAAMAAATGGVLRLGAHVADLQLLIGVLLLLFGVRWLAKAVARHAGLKSLRDEDAEFADTRAELSRGDRNAAWIVAFKGVLLEGLEVWLVVVALGSAGGAWGSAAGAALLALLLVAALGLWVRAPLSRVPENVIKLCVGAMIVAFGTFWTLEALGGADAWPLGDWALPILGLFYLAGSLAIARLLRPARHGEAVS
jgi:uncharacterized membrane protein